MRWNESGEAAHEVIHWSRKKDTLYVSRVDAHMNVTVQPSISHLDFLVLQPDEERAVVRDLIFAVHAFNAHGRGPALQISFPLFTDPKVAGRAMLGPCVRITGPAERLFVLTMRYEVSAHLRSGRAMTFERGDAVVQAQRFETFNLVSPDVVTARPIVLAGHSRLIETAGRMGARVEDEAVFVVRAESVVADRGEIDLLGFSEHNTLPIIR